MEELNVEGLTDNIEALYSAELSRIQTSDSAELLKTLPGANINSNGPLTGIAQYRGMFGDRVNVSIDGGKVANGGPNAMDTPLSNIPAALLKSLTVEQGLASVISAQERIGGHISATAADGEYSNSADFKLAGGVFSQYSSHNKGHQTSVTLGGANQQHKLGLS